MFHKKNVSQWKWKWKTLINKTSFVQLKEEIINFQTDSKTQSISKLRQCIILQKKNKQNGPFGEFCTS